MTLMRWTLPDKRVPQTEEDWREFETALEGAFGKAATYTLDRPMPMGKRKGAPAIKVGWETSGSRHLVGAGLTWRAAISHMKRREKVWKPAWAKEEAALLEDRLRWRREQAAARAAVKRAERALAAAPKVWISTYALTSGIFQAKVSIAGLNAEVLEWCGQGRGRDHYGPGNWHRTKRAAMRAAEKRRQSKIAVCQRQIQRLRRIAIVVEG